MIRPIVAVAVAVRDHDDTPIIGRRSLAERKARPAKLISSSSASVARARDVAARKKIEQAAAAAK